MIKLVKLFILKISIDIGHEVREHNSLLDKMVSLLILRGQVNILGCGFRFSGKFLGSFHASIKRFK